VISEGQYSAIVAAVVASAVVPTLIGNALFLPRHLLPEKQSPIQADALPDSPG
jgi:hypothetical protein